MNAVSNGTGLKYKEEFRRQRRIATNQSVIELFNHCHSRLFMLRPLNQFAAMRTKKGASARLFRIDRKPSPKKPSKKNPPVEPTAVCKETLSEDDLVTLARQGDIEAFGILAGLYEKKTYNLAYRMLGNVEDASDATQEALTKAFSSIVSFKGMSSFSTWLYRIAANICLDELRRRKRNKVVPLDSPLSLPDGEIPRELPSPCETPEQILARKELLGDIQKFILSLSPDHRLSIVLRDIRGLSYEEISQLTGSSLGTVKSRIHRARQALKNTVLNEELSSSMNVASVDRVLRTRYAGDSSGQDKNAYRAGLETGAKECLKDTGVKPDDKNSKTEGGEGS